MRFTTTKMAEQYVQNMYNKPAKETTNTKNNDKVKDNKNVKNQQILLKFTQQKKLQMLYKQ